MNKEAADESEKVNESRVFVEMTSYIKKAIDTGALLYKLSGIHSLYVNRLEDMDIRKTVNKTKLKDQLLECFPEAQEQSDGKKEKKKVFIFKEGKKKMLKKVLTKA